MEEAECKFTLHFNNCKPELKINSSFVSYFVHNINFIKLNDYDGQVMVIAFYKEAKSKVHPKIKILSFTLKPERFLSLH